MSHPHSRQTVIIRFQSNLTVASVARNTLHSLPPGTRWANFVLFALRMYVSSIQLRTLCRTLFPVAAERIPPKSQHIRCRELTHPVRIHGIIGNRLISRQMLPCSRALRKPVKGSRLDNTGKLQENGALRGQPATGLFCRGGITCGSVPMFLGLILDRYRFPW